MPAGTSLAIVGQNGAGKTTLAKLLCRLYDPDTGAIEVDGIDLRDLDLDPLAHSRSPRSSRTLSASSSACATTSTRRGAATTTIRAALADAGAERTRGSGHRPGQGLSGRHGSVRRPVAAGRAGPGPVRRPPGRRPGPARRADRAAGRTGRGRGLRPGAAGHGGRDHDLDLAPVLHRAPRRPDLRPGGRPGDRAGQPRRADGAGGRYRTMFDLQARRFAATMDDEGAVFDVLAADPDDLPPAWSSMWRLCKLGYTHEPRLCGRRRRAHLARGGAGRVVRALAGLLAGAPCWPATRPSSLPWSGRWRSRRP